MGIEEQREGEPKTINKKEEELEEEGSEVWPFFSMEATPSVDREGARINQIQVLRCQEHKAWYIWHPPRPPGCALCPEGGADYPKQLLKDHAANYEIFHM